MIRDVIKKLLLDKKELTLQEKNDLLLYFELQEPGSETIITERNNDGLARFVLEDLTAQITGTNNSFELSQVAIQKVDLSCNLQQLPSSITMYENMKGFYLSFVPTTRDKLVVGYFVK